MSFELPEIHVNSPFTWGPPRREMAMDGLLVRLYQKSDAVAPSDWLKAMAEREERAKESRQFTTVKDEYRLKALRNANAKERRQGPERRFVKRFNNFGNNNNNKGMNKGKRNYNTRNNYMNKAKGNLTLLPDTVAVKSDVRILAEFTQVELAKMQNMEDTPTVADISLHNRPPIYDNNMDKASCKAPIRLDEEAAAQQEFMRSNTVDDKTIREILKKEEAGTHPIVVTTDEVLALMMTCSRSVHPWHVEFFRFNRMIFISKTKDSNIETQWVGETADIQRRPAENDPKESERITQLGIESTKVNNAFVAQSCTKTRYQMKSEKNPFPQTQPRLYRYRRFVMHRDTEDRYDIIVRCEIDAVQNGEYLRLFGLLEQCSEGVNSEWRKTLDSQAAKWTSDEYRRNSQKMARWVSLCHLSGALLKVGFISRFRKSNGTLDPTRHEVLATITKDAGPLAAQLGIKVANMWAIADTLIMAFLKQDEFDDAVLVKRSGEQAIILIEKTADDDDDDEEDEEDDEEEDDDDDEEDDEGEGDE